MQDQNSIRNIHLVASYGVVANSQCETLKAEYNWT